MVSYPCENSRLSVCKRVFRLFQKRSSRFFWNWLTNSWKRLKDTEKQFMNFVNWRSFQFNFRIFSHVENISGKNYIPNDWQPIPVLSALSENRRKTTDLLPKIDDCPGSRIFFTRVYAVISITWTFWFISNLVNLASL